MRETLRRRTEFVSFDGAVRLTAEHQRPDRYRHLDMIPSGPLIARGGGYAYSAASFGGSACVIDMAAFDRMLAFDPIAMTLEVEAGARLIDVFRWAIRRNLCVPVVPGYPLVTIGGCIAGDVHGKNPWRDGTFADWVRAITVFHPSKGYQHVTRESDPMLFGLTCGGFGLSGVIVSATLQLKPLSGTDVDVSVVPVSNLCEAVERLAASTEDFCYSWHDATSRRGFGRGLVMTGRWASDIKDAGSLRFRPMSARTRAALPVGLWNSLTLRCANALYYGIQSQRRVPRRMNLLDAAFPLAKHAGYFRGFGRSGMREVQLLLDAAHIQAFIAALEGIASRATPPLVMASLKSFRGTQRALSQTGEGFLIAIDLLPGSAADRFMAQLDDLMLGMGGQPNLSKDSRIGQAVASQSIRNYRGFAECLGAYDPDRRFRSELSERIGL